MSKAISSVNLGGAHNMGTPHLQWESAEHGKGITVWNFVGYRVQIILYKATKQKAKKAGH
jgi:hypothetical protein